MDIDQELNKISAQVQAKREEAENLGLREIMHYLFFGRGCVTAWHAWLSNNPRGLGDLLRQYAKVVSAFESKENGHTSYKIELDDACYTFRVDDWRQGYEDDTNSYGSVHLLTDKCNVTYKVIRIYNKLGSSESKIQSLERFIGREWLPRIIDLRSDLENMFKEIGRRDAEAKKMSNINTLRENFDLGE
jgi:hypothetical protein